jgi:transposase-like protein
MPCPNCSSPAVRVSEPGFSRNRLICIKCGSAFQRTAPAVKSVAVHGVLVVASSIATALFFGDASLFDDF